MNITRNFLSNLKGEQLKDLQGMIGEHLYGDEKKVLIFHYGGHGGCDGLDKDKLHLVGVDSTPEKPKTFSVKPFRSGLKNRETMGLIFVFGIFLHFCYLLTIKTQYKFSCLSDRRDVIYVNDNFYTKTQEKLQLKTQCFPF